MHKRKLLIGLSTAGLFTAGFGAAILPASAEIRTLTVTLQGGQTIQVTVDVPPGTPLDQLVIPGIDTPIIAISETTTPAPAPEAPAPSAGTEASPSVEPDSVPQAAEQAPQPGDPSTEKREPGPAGVTEATGPATPEPEAPERVATPERAADGVPTERNPTFSLALPGATPIGVPNFFIDKFRIPPFLLPIYQAAGVQYGVRWEVLAAINEIETDYGRNLNVSSAGAMGWMQFIPSTWKAYGVDANDDGKKDPYNPVDAIFAAARYLKAAGADEDIRKAIFAYNHADWYVDSVLMRARLIGGLPSDLIGSLTGLTQGHFPVHATARYADDLTEADTKRRIARGSNAAIPVESAEGRRGIDIYAKAGSPVIAVQDAKVTRIGTSPRLGRFVQVRDLYGNEYTYGKLGAVAKAHPVPKERTVSRAEVRKELELPDADAKPTLPASAGKQLARAARAATAGVADDPKTPSASDAFITKERLFAEPARPEAFENGGQEQLLDTNTSSTTFKSYFTKLQGLKRSDVTIKPLRVGSKVIAGTVLGRIGKTSPTSAPHVLFELRPAGRGAPRVDPKPILDGWKLLESTAVYRATGENPFFGPDAKNPSIGQILLLSKEALQRRVLANPRVELYECGRQDVASGAIDRRVLASLEFLASSGLKPTVTSLSCGRGSIYTASGNLSDHPSGNAVDIAKINDIPILGHQGKGSVTDLAIRRLLTLQGTAAPTQIISLMTYDGAANTLALADHADHIHVGFGRPGSARGAAVAGSVLKPGQWQRLIGRLADIENPEVATKPSKASIDVEPDRASGAHEGE